MAHYCCGPVDTLYIRRMLSKRDGKSLLNCGEEVTNSRHLADVILTVSPWSRICLDHDLPLKLRLSFLTKVGFEHSAESLIWVIKRMIRPKLNEEKSCFQANWIRDLCRQAAGLPLSKAVHWMDGWRGGKWALTNCFTIKGACQSWQEPIDQSALQ